MLTNEERIKKLIETYEYDTENRNCLLKRLRESIKSLEEACEVYRRENIGASNEIKRLKLMLTAPDMAWSPSIGDLERRWQEGAIAKDAQPCRKEGETL